MPSLEQVLTHSLVVILWHHVRTKQLFFHGRGSIVRERGENRYGRMVGMFTHKHSDWAAGRPRSPLVSAAWASCMPRHEKWSRPRSSFVKEGGFNRQHEWRYWQDGENARHVSSGRVLYSPALADEDGEQHVPRPFDRSRVYGKKGDSKEHQRDYVDVGETVRTFIAKTLHNLLHCDGCKEGRAMPPASSSESADTGTTSRIGGQTPPDMVLRPRVLSFTTEERFIKLLRQGAPVVTVMTVPGYVCAPSTST